MVVTPLPQTVSWLRAESSTLEDCSQTVSEFTDLKNLLLHHKNMKHLEQHVPPYSMGENISSSLAAIYSQRVASPTQQPNRSNLAQDCSDDKNSLVLVEDVAVEIITISEFAEVETVLRENQIEVDNTHSVSGDPQVVVSKERTEVEEEANQHTVPSQQKGAAGPHDCPHCQKKFKFASSLVAHRVIHTGERPHHCSDCGRSFSFRQSLDRHRQTHKVARTYDCVLCKETFRSLSARTEHKKTHMGDGIYTCHRCGRKFSWELSLVRHLKTHANDHSASQAAGSCRRGSADSGSNEKRGEPDEHNCQVQGGERDKRFPEGGAHQNSESRVPVPELGDDAHRVQVRTSRRKRTPTMKIQGLHLQKHMATKTRDVPRVNPTTPGPPPFICSEHSYGSPVVSKEGDEGSSTDTLLAVSCCPQCSFHHSEVQVQQHTDKVHSTQRNSAAQILTHEGSVSYADCEFPPLLNAHRCVHTGEQPFSCSQCRQVFSFKQSDRHRRTHKSECTYKCLICGQLFKSAAERREHRNSHMENGKYLCSVCGQTFTWRSALVRHLKVHGIDADRVKDSHKCPRCQQGFSCDSDLNRHLQTHKERVHTCNCGKSFACRAALTTHQRIHLKDRPHTCKQCGKGFLYRGGLLSHMKIHSEEMPFMCSFCGKGFKRERNMKKHEHCHTRENVFSCSQCDKSFVYKATLVRHELTHSGERPYLCSDCGKSFFSHAELLKHERFHTGHKPFQCPHCGKKFTQSCYLTIHLRYHTGVRPYSCSGCDKSFLSANRLKRHQRTHSGEKPYLCGECGKGFRQSYHLKMHQRTHLT